MKTPSHSSRRATGFTLVELLVVIAIIVVLVSLAVPAILNALEDAKKAPALNAATGVEHAIDAYYNIYGALPVDSAAPFATNSATGREMLAILMAKEPAVGTLKNPRKIPFFTGKAAKSKNDGVYFEEGAPEGLYDRWGKPFTVVLDSDYDQEITVPIPTGGDGIIRNRNAAIYSLGKDPTAKVIPPKNLIRTWTK